MMGWDLFIYFAAACICCSVLASVLAFLERRKAAIGLASAGAAALAGFICILWVTLERPPLRTINGFCHFRQCSPLSSSC